MAKGDVIPTISNPEGLAEDAVKAAASTKPKKVVDQQKKNAAKATKTAPKRPEITKKQKRVQKIVEDPETQEKLKKKVSSKRATRDNDTVTKNGGDDSRKTRQKKAQPEQLQNPSAKSKSVRGRNT